MVMGLLYDQRFQEHDTGPGHPERPARLQAVVEGLQEAGLWEAAQHLDFEPAELAEIQRLHQQHYVDRLFEAAGTGQAYIDSPDSAICPDSPAIAQLAVGAAHRAVDAVASGEVQQAFCAVRPPGHHAEADHSMGFCLFNNVALAAERLIRRHGYQRVAIVDFDVHHGNGTQHLFEDRADILFISLHQDPRTLFPGTGFASERGKGAGEGYTLNLPMEPGSGDQTYLETMREQLAPALTAFQPDFLLVSAGFDAAEADPLANMAVSADGFDGIARFLEDQARRLCGGRLVSTLEGGYDLGALKEGIKRYVTGGG